MPRHSDDISRSPPLICRCSRSLATTTCRRDRASSAVARVVHRSRSNRKEDHDMRCSFVGLCLVGTIACAAHAEAEPGRQGREATATGCAGQTGVTGNALLDGLINFNIQQLLVSIQFVTNVQDTVINVSDVLNGFQIQALIQALNSNPVASLNANNLSFALQQSGR